MVSNGFDKVVAKNTFSKKKRGGNKNPWSSFCAGRFFTFLWSYGVSAGRAFFEKRYIYIYFPYKKLFLSEVRCFLNKNSFYTYFLKKKYISATGVAKSRSFKNQQRKNDQLSLRGISRRAARVNVKVRMLHRGFWPARFWGIFFHGLCFR